MSKRTTSQLLTTMPVCVAVLAVTVLIAAADPLAEADALWRLGGLEDYSRAVALYRKALNEHPDDYDANWKYARACRSYGKALIEQQRQDWQKKCAEYGKKGMEHAEKAAALKPQRPEGHYYYGLCVGVYADGVSIITALTEGLKNKTEKALAKAYAIDKMYDRAGPILSLARFWSILPWPLRNREKALQYFREYQATPYFSTTDRAKIYLAELLLNMKGEARRGEAVDLLQQAAHSDSEFYRNWAKRLLAAHS